MPSAVIGSALFGDREAFAATISTSIALGSNAGRWLLLGVYVPSITSDTHIQSATIGGLALTKEADESHNDIAIGQGRIAWFRSDTATIGSMPTGSQTLLVTCADNGGKPQAFVVWGEGAESLAASVSGTRTASGNVTHSTNAVTSAAGSVVVGIGSIGGTGSMTLTGVSGTTIYGGAGADVGWQFGSSEAGASSVTQEATLAGSSATPWLGWRAWNVVGIASAPVISGPNYYYGMISGE